MRPLVKWCRLRMFECVNLRLQRVALSEGTLVRASAHGRAETPCACLVGHRVGIIDDHLEEHTIALRTLALNLSKVSRLSEVHCGDERDVELAVRGRVTE